MDPRVTSHDCDERRWVAELFGCRKVNGVERANRFDRERTPDAREHRVGHGHEVASSCKDLERPHRRALV